jgi:hypothetical protein
LSLAMEVAAVGNLLVVAEDGADKADEMRQA